MGRTGTLRRSASKAIGVVTVAVKDNLQYRFAFLSASLGTSFSILVQMLFWNGVYSLNNVESIAGYDQAGMLSYIFIAQIVNRLAHASDTLWSYAHDIRSGDLNAYLLRPMGYYQYRLGMLIGGRIVDAGASLLPFVLMLLVAGKDFVISWAGVLLAIPVVTAVFFLYFNMDCLVGTLAFWLGNVSAISYFKWVLFGFLGGRFFPLDLLPGWAGSLAKVLPFSYLVYYPAQIMSGQILDPGYILGVFANIFAWSAVFFAFSRFAWRRGLKRYSALGG